MLLVACLGAGACSSEAARSDDEGVASSTTAAEPEPGSADAAESSSSSGEPEPDTRRCIPPQDAPASPGTVAEAVDLLNALPEPVDIACFLESLERPLKIHATTSSFSAQPAYDADNPRIFIFEGELVMSVVPAGEGTHLLEFGEFVDPFQTIKAELELPLEGLVAPADPYSRVRFEQGIGCGLCHRNEHEVGTIDGEIQFASLAYQPLEFHELDERDVRDAHEACEGEDTRRCRILRALFDHGPVLFTVFPEDLPTFGG